MIPLSDSVQLSQNILMPYCNLLRYNLLMEKKNQILVMDSLRLLMVCTVFIFIFLYFSTVCMSKELLEDKMLLLLQSCFFVV